jgi:hypothetical protein
MEKEREFEALVEKLLRRAKLDFVKQPVMGETRPDFLVTTEHGDQIVVEAKAWASNPDSTARAIHQAKLYKNLSRAAAVIIVTTAVAAPLAFGEGAVVPLAALLPSLAELALRLAARKEPRAAVGLRPSPKKKVFASMPFNSQYDDTFFVAVQPAALALNAFADRVDHTGHPGDIVKQIKHMIKDAHVVIADLSESRPNVCHEIGYAEALGRPIVQICSSPLSSFAIQSKKQSHNSIFSWAGIETKDEAGKRIEECTVELLRIDIYRVKRY